MAKAGYRSVSMEEDFLVEVRAAVEAGTLKKYAIRSVPQAIEFATRRFLEAEAGS